MDATQRFLAAVERAEAALQLRAARRGGGGHEAGGHEAGGGGGGGGGGPGGGSFAAETLATLAKLAAAQETVAGVAAAYASFAAATAGGGRGLTDRERDAFDARLAAVVAEERAKVDALRAAVQNAGAARPGSALAHRQVVVHRLYELLQDITKASGELQLLRLRHTTSSRKALYSSALDDARADERRQTDAHIASLVKQAQQHTRFAGRNPEDSDGDDYDDVRSPAGTSGQELRRRRPSQRTPHDAEANPALEGSDDDGIASRDHFVESELAQTAGAAGEDQVIDQELMQVLESEQSALQSRLERELEAVKQAETQMNEFSQMLSVFNDKIVEQSESVDNIFKDVQTSTVFMDMSREELLSAKSHSSNFRRNVILFFVIASGLLLILDAMD